MGGNDDAGGVSRRGMLKGLAAVAATPAVAAAASVAAGPAAAARALTGGSGGRPRCVRPARSPIRGARPGPT